MKKTDYFYHSIPLSMPSHMDESNRDKWESTAKSIDQRMQKLETALAISGLEGEVFADAAKALFDVAAEVPQLDRLDAEEIASFCRLKSRGVEMPQRYEWPNAEVVVDTAFVTTKEWEMLRGIGLGGSEVAVVLNISHFQSQRSLYHLKKGTPIKWEPEDKGLSFIFAYGHKLESLVIETFCNRTGAQVIPESRMFRSKEHPEVTANIDGIVKLPALPEQYLRSTIEKILVQWDDGYDLDTMDDHLLFGLPVMQLPALLALHDAGVDFDTLMDSVMADPAWTSERIFILEAKTTTTFNRDAWEGNKIPPYYATQCRQYMAVLNDPRICGAYICCIYGNTPSNFLCRMITRNFTKECGQLEAEDDFWNRYVLSGVEPEADSEADIEVVRKVSGPAIPSSVPVRFSGDLADVCKSYLELKGKITRLETQKSDLQAAQKLLSIELMELLGQETRACVDCPDGEDPEAYEITWSPRKRGNVDKDLLKEKYPAIFAEVYHENPESSRVFDIKRKPVQKIKGYKAV